MRLFVTFICAVAACCSLVTRTLQASEHTDEWVAKAVSTFGTYCFETEARFYSVISLVRERNLQRAPMPSLPSSLDRRDPAVALIESTQMYIAHQKSAPETYVLLGTAPAGLCVVNVIGVPPLESMGDRLNAALKSKFPLTLIRSGVSGDETETVYVVGQDVSDVEDLSKHRILRVTSRLRRAPVNTATVTYMHGPLFATQFKW